MKLRINSGGRRFTIPLPRFLLLNPVSGKIIASDINRHMGKYLHIDENAPPLKIPYFQMRKLLRAASKSIKHFKGTHLVHIKSANGDIVEIIF